MDESAIREDQIGPNSTYKIGNKT